MALFSGRTPEDRIEEAAFKAAWKSSSRSRASWPWTSPLWTWRGRKALAAAKAANKAKPPLLDDVVQHLANRGYRHAWTRWNERVGEARATKRRVIEETARDAAAPVFLRLGDEDEVRAAVDGRVRGGVPAGAVAERGHLRARRGRVRGGRLRRRAARGRRAHRRDPRRPRPRSGPGRNAGPRHGARTTSRPTPRATRRLPPSRFAATRRSPSSARPWRWTPRRRPSKRCPRTSWIRSTEEERIQAATQGAAAAAAGTASSRPGAAAAAGGFFSSAGSAVGSAAGRTAIERPHDRLPALDRAQGEAGGGRQAPRGRRLRARATRVGQAPTRPPASRLLPRTRTWARRSPTRTPSAWRR